MTVISKNLGLIQGIHTGVTPPSNTFMIWVDTSVAPQAHKVYDELATAWIDIKPSSLIREAVEAVFDDAGNALPSTTATAIDGYTIIDNDRVIVLDSLSGSEINKIYVASVTGISIVWNVTQDGSGSDLPVAGTTTWVINGTNYGSSQAVFDDTTWQFHDPHVQNTDTGTTQSSFDIDSQGTGVKLKNVAGELQLRDLIDTTWADLRVGNLTVEGTQTIVNSEIVEIADNIITLNSNVTSGAPSEDGGIHIRRGDEDNASMLWNETLDKWTAGIDGSELPILLADQANTLSAVTSLDYGSYSLGMASTKFKLERNDTNDIVGVGVDATAAFLSADNGTNVAAITADVTNGLVITDDMYSVGVVYGSEYTSSDRKWLTHKGYVDDLVSGASPFEYDGVQSVRVKGYQGVGTVDMTNGSGAISGNGTNFLDGTPYTGVAWWGQIWVHDSVQWHRITINPTAATNASIYDSYNESKIKSGYLTTSATFEGVTGTYDFYVTQQIADDGGAFSIGNNGWAEDLGTALGSGVATGNMSLATGQETLAEGIQGSSFNKWTRAEGDFSFAGGLGQSISTKQIIASGQTSFNFSENTIAQTAGYGALADNSAILGGIDNHIPSDSPRSVIIGGSGIVAEAALADMVYVPNLKTAGSVHFGIGNTRIVESVANLMNIYVGSNRLELTTSYVYSGGQTNSWALKHATTTSTVPGFIPNRGDLLTGVGGGVGEIDLITNSLSRLNISDTLITANKPIRISTIGDALEFGDGDTKISESADDILKFQAGDGSTDSFQFLSGVLTGNTGQGGASIRIGGNLGIAYTFRGDTDSGIDYIASDNWAAIINNTSVLDFTATLQTFSTVVSGVEPTIDAHLATKEYVDRIASQDSKDSAELATTASITLSGEQTIDGILTSTSRILVKNQGTAADNGIYVTDSGAWSRSDDADDDNEVTSGMRIWVDSGGTANGNTEWTLTTANPIIVGTTGLTFTKTGEAGYIDARNGLTKSGNFIELGGTLLGATDINTDTYALSLSGTGGLDLKSNELSSSTGMVLVNDAIRISGQASIRGSGSQIQIRNSTNSAFATLKALRLRLETSGSFHTELLSTASTSSKTISFPNLDGTVMLNLVEDITPQLGGNLDLQSFNVIGSGVANTTSGFSLGSDTLWLNHATNTGMEIDFGATSPSVRRKDDAAGILFETGGVYRFLGNPTLRPDTGASSVMTISGNRQTTTGGVIKLTNYASVPFQGGLGISQYMLNLDTTLNQSSDASFNLIEANVNETTVGSGERNLISLSVGGGNRFKISTDGYINISAPQTASVSDDEFLVRTSTGEIKQRNIDDIAGDHALGSHSDTDFTDLADNDLMYRSGGEWIDTNGGLTWNGSYLNIPTGEVRVGNLRIDYVGSAQVDMVFIGNNGKTGYYGGQLKLAAGLELYGPTSASTTGVLLTGGTLLDDRASKDTVIVGQSAWVSAITNLDGSDVIIDGGALVGAGADGNVLIATTRGLTIIGDTTNQDTTSILQVSPNIDVTTILGNAKLYRGDAGWITFSHYDVGANDFALRHHFDGWTTLNAATGTSIQFAIGKTTEWTIDSSGDLIGSAGNSIITDGGTMGSPAIQGTDNNSGIYFSSANTLISVNNTQVLSVGGATVDIAVPALRFTGTVNNTIQNTATNARLDFRTNITTSTLSITTPAFSFDNSSAFVGSVNGQSGVDMGLFDVTQTGSSEFNGLFVRVDDTTSSSSGVLSVIRAEIRDNATTRSGQIHLLLLENDGSDVFIVDQDGNTTLADNVHLSLGTTTGNAGQLQFGNGDTYITESSNDNLGFYIGGQLRLQISDTFTKSYRNFIPNLDSTYDLGSSTTGRWNNIFFDPTVTSSSSDDILTVNLTTGGIETRTASSLGAEHNLTDHLDVNTTGLATGSLLYFDSANWVDTGTDLLWDGSELKLLGQLHFGGMAGSAQVGADIIIPTVVATEENIMNFGDDSRGTVITHEQNGGNESWLRMKYRSSVSTVTDRFEFNLLSGDLSMIGGINFLSAGGPTFTISTAAGANDDIIIQSSATSGAGGAITLQNQNTFSSASSEQVALQLGTSTLAQTSTGSFIGIKQIINDVAADTSGDLSFLEFELLDTYTPNSRTGDSYFARFINDATDVFRIGTDSFITSSTLTGVDYFNLSYGNSDANPSTLLQGYGSSITLWDNMIFKVDDSNDDFRFNSSTDTTIVGIDTSLNHIIGLLHLTPGAYTNANALAPKGFTYTADISAQLTGHATDPTWDGLFIDLTTTGRTSTGDTNHIRLSTDATDVFTVDKDGVVITGSYMQLGASTNVRLLGGSNKLTILTNNGSTEMDVQLKALIMRNSTGFTTLVDSATGADDFTITFPAADGTVALTSSISDFNLSADDRTTQGITESPYLLWSATTQESDTTDHRMDWRINVEPLDEAGINNELKIERQLDGGGFVQMLSINEDGDLALPGTSLIGFPGIGASIQGYSAVLEFRGTTFNFKPNGGSPTLALTSTSSIFTADNGTSPILTIKRDGQNSVFIESDNTVNILQIGTTSHGLQVSTSGTNELEVKGPAPNLTTSDYSIKMSLGAVSGGNLTYTTGHGAHLGFTSNYVPTSGTGTFSVMEINPTIDQNATATGITRGIYINPTLTDAAEWRAIDIAESGVSKFSVGEGGATTFTPSAYLDAAAETPKSISLVADISGQSTTFDNTWTGIDIDLAITGRDSGGAARFLHFKADDTGDVFSITDYGLVTVHTTAAEGGAFVTGAFSMSSNRVAYSSHGAIVTGVSSATTAVFKVRWNDSSTGGIGGDLGELALMTNSISGLTVDANQTVIINGDGFITSVGNNTTERVATQGSLRYNTTDGNFEGYDGSAWKDLQASGSDTATAADDILEGTNSGTEITYAPYSVRTTATFYTGVSNPIATGRLNYDGDLYVTHLYLPNSGDTATAATHYYVETGGSNLLPKTLANTKIEILELTGLTVGEVFSADSATTASWKAPTGGTTITADHIAYATATDTLGGSSDFTYDGTQASIYATDVLSSSVSRPLDIIHNSSFTTPTAGMGVGLTFRAETSTTESQSIGFIDYHWTTATHASRTSKLTFWAYDNVSLISRATFAADGIVFNTGTGHVSVSAGYETGVTADHLVTKQWVDDQSFGTGGGDVTAGTQNNTELAFWNSTAKEIEGSPYMVWDDQYLRVATSLTGARVELNRLGAFNVYNSGNNAVAVFSTSGSHGFFQVNNISGTTVAELSASSTQYAAKFTATTSIQIPSGTTGERPGTPALGMIRWNTTGTNYEGYNGSGWDDLSGGGGTIGGSIADNQIAVGSGSDTIDGSSGLQWDDTILSVQGNIGATGTITATVADAATNATTVATLSHNTSATPAVGFGTRLDFAGESSTTPDTYMGDLRYIWNTTTHASRSSQISMYGVVNTSFTLFAKFNEDGAFFPITPDTGTTEDVLVYGASGQLKTVTQASLGSAYTAGSGLRLDSSTFHMGATGNDELVTASMKFIPDTDDTYAVVFGGGSSSKVMSQFYVYSNNISFNGDVDDIVLQANNGAENVLRGHTGGVVSTVKVAAVARVTANTSASIGSGTSIAYDLPHDTSSNVVWRGGDLSMVSTVLTAGSESADFYITLKTAGTLNERLRLKDDGQLQLPEYDGSTFTGTAVASLAVDASGNLIEEALATGTIGGSISSGRIAVGSGVNTIANVDLQYSYEGGDTPTIYTGDDYIEIMAGGLAGTSILISDADNYITTSSGTNVGIATSAPNALLSVGGNGVAGVFSVEGTGSGNIMRVTEDSGENIFDITGEFASTYAISIGDYDGVVDGAYLQIDEAHVGLGIGGDDILIVNDGNYAEVTSRLGIGTTGPNASLHLNEVTSGGVAIDFTNSSTGTTAGSGLTIGMDGSENAFMWHREDNDIYFGTGVSTAERMRISYLGYITTTGGIVATMGAKTAAYTLLLSDNGKIIEFNTASVDVTFPQSGFPNGWNVQIVNRHATGVLTFVTSGTATMSGKGTKLASQWGGATVYHRSGDDYVAIGDLTT